MDKKNNMNQTDKKTMHEMVKEFHAAFDQPIREGGTSFVHLYKTERKLRRALIEEEAAEYVEAEQNEDFVEVADALADLIYVCIGTAISYGIDIDAVFEEVHRSNMSKLDENGNPVYRANGKVTKSKLFQPPDIMRVLLDGARKKKQESKQNS